MNVKCASYGNTGTMAKDEIRTIALDFTPDFVCIVREPTYDQYNRVHTYCGIVSDNLSEELTAVTYAPNMRLLVVNGDTISNWYNQCDIITIIENGIEITDGGFGSSNVFWIAIKCK